jgi:hypothetical protein
MVAAIGRFLSQDAAAIQAFSALATLVLTAVLVAATIVYVRATHRILQVSHRQLGAVLYPQAALTLRYQCGEDGTVSGFIVIRNAGQQSFQIGELTFDYYCSMAESSFVEPIEFQLLMYRVLAPTETVEVPFQANPGRDCVHHEPHAGACKWNLRASADVQDLLGVTKHHYYYDTGLGLHHIGLGSELSWFRVQRARWGNRYRRYKYLAKFWLKKQYKRISQLANTHLGQTHRKKF